MADTDIKKDTSKTQTIESWDWARSESGNITGVNAVIDGKTVAMGITKQVVDIGTDGEYDRFTLCGDNCHFVVDLVARSVDFGGVCGLGSRGFSVAIANQGELITGTGE